MWIRICVAALIALLAPAHAPAAETPGAGSRGEAVEVIRELRRIVAPACCSSCPGIPATSSMRRRRCLRRKTSD